MMTLTIGSLISYNPFPALLTGAKNKKAPNGTHFSLFEAAVTLCV
jgi:hypothetical protein